MPPRTPVHVALDRFGRNHGMELHRRAWYQRTEELVAVCGLQKSQYGDSYYVNLGFNFAVLAKDTHPHPERCHLRFRIEQLLGGEAEAREVRDLLDLDTELEDSVREERLFEILNRSVGPVLERGVGVAGVRAMVLDGTLPSYMLTLKARTALDIPVTSEDAQT